MVVWIDIEDDCIKKRGVEYPLISVHEHVTSLTRFLFCRFIMVPLVEFLILETILRNATGEVVKEILHE